MKKSVKEAKLSNNTVIDTPFRRLVLHSAVMAALFGGGYGRGAYAGTCTAGPVSVCSGAADDGVDTTQSLSGTLLTVTTTPGFGIDTTQTGGNALTLSGTNDLIFTDANASSITGKQEGIYARHTGTGTLGITSNGAVTGKTRNGITARGFGTDLIITAASVTGARYGIDARNGGSGELTITSSGQVWGESRNGLWARNYGTDMTIATAAVAALKYGIQADNRGSGALTISSNRLVRSIESDGIFARNFGTDLSITTANVSGQDNAIRADNQGTGALRITSSARVMSSVRGNGISAFNEGTDLTITTETVIGASNGIVALNDGTGALSITSNDVVTGNGNRGIYASNFGTSLTITADAVSGSSSAIEADNDGTGALSITSNDLVTSSRGAGIHAQNSESGTDLTIVAVGEVNAYYGIYGRNDGSGAVSITSKASVTGSGGFGIMARNNYATGTDLTITSLAVTGASSGIHARSRASGALSISSGGDVTGALGNGIYARAIEGTDMLLTTTAVSGGVQGNGIYAYNWGTGALRINSSGAVTGAGNHGISARTRIGTDLTIATAAVSGKEDGISAHNQGVGVLSISSSGEVTGGQNGISARNYREGGLSISTASTVTGVKGSGIHATNIAADGLTLTTAAVSGGLHGIYAANKGWGELSLTSTNTVSGTRDNGISARNGMEATDITLTTATVMGGYDGIHARNIGRGALSIDSSGAVTGSRHNGIYAYNFDYATDLTVDTAATVTGGQDGIQLRNFGSGATNITSSGTVTGTSRNGIYASTRNHAGTGLTITTAAVTGGAVGIGVRSHSLNGALNITSSGEVVGTNIVGIYASNYGTDLTISTSAVRGGRTGIRADIIRGENLSIRSDGEVMGYVDGIDARSRGEGALTVTSNAAVTGSTGSGIEAINYRYGTDLTLSMSEVTGGKDGIYALNFAAGALNVTSSGAVTGASNNGIALYNDYRSSELTLTTAAVTGGETGIYARHDGAGTLTITTNGTVTGGTGNALWLERTVAGTTDGTITNNGRLVSGQDAAVRMGSDFNFGGNFINNGDITGGNGTAFDISAAGRGMVFDQVTGTITGNVLLGRGDDVVNVSGGTINGQIIGQGFGTVNIDVGAGKDFTSHGVVNVKDYVIRSGTVHQLGDFSTAAATTTVSNGATLSFNSLVNGAGALVSSGNLEFIVNPAPGGQLVQAGTVTLNEGSTISINYNGAKPVPNQSLLLISATSLIDNGVDVYAGEYMDSLLYEFHTVFTSDSFSLQTSVADLGGLSSQANPAAFGDSMTSFVNAGGDNAVVDLLAGLPAGDVQGFEQIADVFSPSVSGAVSQGALESNDSTWRLVNERFVGSESGERSGQPQNGLWLQGYGGEADQDSIDHVEGFDADTGGVALGYDRDLDQWRIGAAFSSGDTDVDNDRYAGDSVDIESNQFLVYGGYWQDQWFAGATASYAALDYDLKRNNRIAGEGPIKGDTDGDLYGLSVSGGYQYTVSGIALTPQLALRYNTLGVDEYNENGGLDLQVKYNDIDTLASELGVSASASYALDSWQLSPIARLAWVHEYLGEKEKARASYSGQSYIQQGFEPDADLASVDLGLEASNGQGLSVGIDYRGTLGSDYSRNQGWLNLRYEF